MLLLLALAGCHPTRVACEDYIALSTECQNEALGAAGGLDDEAIAEFCERELEAATPSDKRDARDGFACAADAYDGVDCSDLDAYNQASSAAAACLR